MRLKLAARKSDLARWQAVQVARLLEKLPSRPEIEFLFKSSLGDQNLDIPLANMGARGVFTEDFYEDLIQGRCDLVVHSWKDLPVEERDDTRIVMTLPRADLRDILMVPEIVWQEALKAGHLTVLTSSPRRVYNLSQALPKLLPGNLKIEFKNVRGNVPTRLRKMHEEKAALVLAKAGLDRLLEAEKENFTEQSVRALIQDCRFQVYPISLNPPAPAQGALAIEVARGNEKVSALCTELNHELTFKSVVEEREVLSRYGGGCHQKIGVARLPRPYGMVRALRGLTDSGEVLNEWRIEDGTEWPKAALDTKIFPLEARHNSWFERKPIAVSLENEGAFFVSRAEAWPAGLTQTGAQLVWTAGVQTWRKLASMGLFVSGCQDGLGENEDYGLGILRGELEWCKLSHSSAPKGQGKFIATYELIAKAQTPDLRGKTHFFWLSSTAFERARQLYPDEIRNAYNACGPGYTYDFLKGKNDLRHPVKVFAGLEQFISDTRP